MTSIFEPRSEYRPFTHEHYFKYFTNARDTTWRPETVNMLGDISDFEKATAIERDIIKLILRSFTIKETFIGDYWADRVPAMFPKHEIIAAARAHSFQEVNHAQAYDWLNVSLGIDNYKEFIDDPVASAQIEAMINAPDDLLSLAVFSGCAEGMSLFSSFAVLLSFARDGRFKGLAQIISWSILDEMMHSQMGCELFVEAQAETGSDYTDKIIEAFDAAVLLEFKYIVQMEKIGDIPSINYNDLADFIRYRANNRLEALGIYYRYELNSSYKNIKTWFDLMVFGRPDQDFFANKVEGSGYQSILSQSYSDYDFTTTKLKDWGIN